MIPRDILGKFHFTFLIRHPRYSVPSYYRCTVPPLDAKTGFYDFMSSEAGYDELHRVFDYLRSVGQVGPTIATRPANKAPASEHESVDGYRDGGVEICVIDADDLLDDPMGVIKAYCKSVGVPFTETMMKWDNEKDQKQAREAFAKWFGFHEDAINSCELRKREQVSSCHLNAKRESRLMLTVIKEEKAEKQGGGRCRLAREVWG